jgi:hypothetical protein
MHVASEDHERSAHGALFYRCGRVAVRQHLGWGAGELAAAQIPELELGYTPRTMVEGIAVAVGGLLLIIATQWDSLGESSQRHRMPGGWFPCVRLVR